MRSSMRVQPGSAPPLEQLVLGVEEGEQGGGRFDLSDEAVYGVPRRALVEPGRVQRGLALLDAECLQSADERVAPGEVPVQGGPADPRTLGDLVHGRGGFAGQQGRGTAQHMSSVDSHETTIAHMRHQRLIKGMDVSCVRC